MKVLFLGAHPDDVEIGCGGTIAKRVGIDNQLVVVFSRCETHSGLDFTGEKLSEELRVSMEILGVRDYNQLEFENTRFPEASHGIRGVIEHLRSSFNPDIVYMPSLTDQHQDHRTLAEQCILAFRRGREELRSYELLTTTPDFSPVVFVDIGSTIKLKIKVLLCYESQLVRKHHLEELWVARALSRGIPVGVRYAEGFELHRRHE